MSVNALYNDGNDWKLFMFPTVAAHDSWWCTVLSLKAEISNINELDPIMHRVAYVGWIVRVLKFGRKVGHAMVPNDIKKAVHSVQDGEGWVRTVWVE